MYMLENVLILMVVGQRSFKTIWEGYKRKCQYDRGYDSSSYKYGGYVFLLDLEHVNLSLHDSKDDVCLV